MAGWICKAHTVALQLSSLIPFLHSLFFSPDGERGQWHIICDKHCVRGRDKAHTHGVMIGHGTSWGVFNFPPVIAVTLFLKSNDGEIAMC